MLKVLMIGLGGIGQRHVRNLRTLLGSEVEILAFRVRGLRHVVTATLQVAPGGDVEQEYGIRVLDNLDDALAEAPRLAFICNPSSLHISAATACVQAGCDVFLEKPISHNLEGVFELEELARTLGRVIMVGYQLRFHPCFRELQQLLQNDSVGPIITARATIGEYLPGWHPYEDYRQMYAARADLGGGVITSQIHEFDYLYALFGRPVRIFSLGGHLTQLEIDVEDVASTLIEFKREDRSLPVHLHQDYIQRPASRSCEIIGEKGKALMDLVSMSMIHTDNAGRIVRSFKLEHFERNQLFLDELRHFLDCAERRREPVPNFEDGIWSLRMALAAKESIAQGRVVMLDEYAKSCS